MGTNSRIAVQGVTGGCKSIHCQYDGYVSGVGLTLFQSYHGKSVADALIRLGDLSTVGPEIGIKHDFEWRSKWGERNRPRFRGEDNLTDWDAYHAELERQPESRWCLAYGRDRGEKGVGHETHASLPELVEKYGGYEYSYLFSRGTWWLLVDVDTQFPERSTWTPLYDAIKADEAARKELAAKRQRYPVASPIPFQRPSGPPITRAAPVTQAPPPPPPAAEPTVVPGLGADRTIVTGRSRTIVL